MALEALGNNLKTHGSVASIWHFAHLPYVVWRPPVATLAAVNSLPAGP